MATEAKSTAKEAKSILRFTRVTPRKLRLVVDLIRGKHVDEAFAILRYSPKSASRVIQKVLKSAVANAEDLEVGDADELIVSRVFVDGGPVLKRFRARSMGRANPIKKRTSHVTIFVSPEVRKRRAQPRPAATAAAKPAKAPDAGGAGATSPAVSASKKAGGATPRPPRSGAAQRSAQPKDGAAQAKPEGQA